MFGTTDLAKFKPTESAIQEMANVYMPLVIDGVEDTDGFNAVHAARMVVKGKRVGVEKDRKAEKVKVLEYGRRLDDEAKRIVALLEPIEIHLRDQEDGYRAAKQQIKNAARLKAETEEREEAEAEAARIKAEQDAENERLRVEREKLEAERAEMEAKREAEQARQREAREKIDAEREKIDAEKKRLADIEADRIRAENLETAKAEAAANAKRETEERIAREAKEARVKAEAEEAARLKAESLWPDREKLAAVAAAVAAITVPAVSEDAASAAHEIRQVIVIASRRIEKIAAGDMTPNPF